MEFNGEGLVVAVEQLSAMRGRMDAVHSDGAKDGGGDGHGSSGGDGLNIPESS
ncbi:hypothetical protein AB8O55_11860 [Saccharopolyspora cebuensis]|uniref:Uncharacterized protein n=1 Tax=Saccharopolyspora cebuensis TaxID=418759 RepID=A0ABV4CIZ2_9PSEU